MRCLVAIVVCFNVATPAVAQNASTQKVVQESTQRAKAARDAAQKRKDAPLYAAVEKLNQQKESGGKYYAEPHLSLGKVGAVSVLRLTIEPSGEKRGPFFEIRQIIDGENALVDFTEDDHAIHPGSEKRFWLKGISTKDRIDDETLRLSGVFYISGTTQYVTAGIATKTIPVLEQFPTEGSDSVFETAAVVEKKQPPARQRRPPNANRGRQ